MGVAVALLMVLPIVHLLLRAASAGDLSVLWSQRVIDATVDTVALAVVVTAAATVIGTVLALVIDRIDLPAARLLGVVACLPLAVPTYVLAVTFKDAFGVRGLVTELPVVAGFSGAAIVLTLSTYPYVLLVVRAALASADPALEEAARSLGDANRMVLRRVVLPLLRPAASAGALLVFLYVLSDFGAVSILRYRTLTTAIFTEYRTTFDRSSSALLAVVLVVLTVLAIVLQRVARGRAAPARAVSGTRPRRRADVGMWRWPVVILVVLPAAIGVVVTAGVLVYRASLSSGSSDAARVVAGAAATSVALSAGAALACVVLAVPVATLAVRFRSRLTATIEGASAAGYALPGLVIALALVFFTARYVPAVYQTAGVVIFAYVIRFFPEALGATRTAVAAVDPALEEAARSLGDGRGRVVRRVTVPLVGPGLAAGAALVFLTAMKELPATLVLRPPGYDTLATRVWTGAAEGFYRQAAPSALVLLAVSSAALWPLLRGDRRKLPEVPV